MEESLVRSSRNNHVGIITINRPEAKNALSLEMVKRMGDYLLEFDSDNQIHVIIIHGDGKSFSAGADINDMTGSHPVNWYRDDPLSVWDRIKNVRKPVIAAVTGYALGGGCELSMMCDIVIAGESALFGQPEIKVGIIPGAGGTQRLIRAVGKALAMDMILTGRLLSAKEALAAGLISRVVQDETCLKEAMSLAQIMANTLSPMALIVAKEAVNSASEMTMNAGLRNERNLFHLLTASEDHMEGILAFLEKRQAQYHGK